MKNYKPKEQDVVRCSIGPWSAHYRLVKPMTEQECEVAGLRSTINGERQGATWLATEVKSNTPSYLLFGTYRSDGGEIVDMSGPYVLLEREGIAWES